MGTESDKLGKSNPHKKNPIKKRRIQTKKEIQPERRNPIKIQSKGPWEENPIKKSKQKKESNLRRNPNRPGKIQSKNPNGEGIQDDQDKNPKLPLTPNHKNLSKLQIRVRVRVRRLIQTEKKIQSWEEKSNPKKRNPNLDPERSFKSNQIWES